ncbi:hypothetical protein HNR39_000241 [Glaciimonas immobilis]|uniref:Uncharacterized protein n=1 Tax=Glaciimonas immobilis TaxID=728004 RepID=A0A840RP71_9BURK|nr:hypothetical protein [Glaciimonas immobilis]
MTACEEAASGGRQKSHSLRKLTVKIQSHIINYGPIVYSSALLGVMIKHNILR